MGLRGLCTGYLEGRDSLLEGCRAGWALGLLLSESVSLVCRQHMTSSTPVDLVFGRDPIASY